jgi:hypothetical protein
MGFETPGTNNEALNTNENLTQFENRIQEIKDALASQGYSKELDLEFVKLWKNMPAGVSDKTDENIDEIRNLLMDTHPDKE